MNTRFVADVHLGRLARVLRLFGIDTIYQNNYDFSAICTIAASEHRTILSRNPAFAKEDLAFFRIDNEHWQEQLLAIFRAFHLNEQTDPFTRCLVCNGLLLPVAKELIVHKLQPQTLCFYNEFWQCVDCHRVYWKGAHYQRMVDLIRQIEGHLSGG